MPPDTAGSAGQDRITNSAACPPFCPWCGARVAEWGHDDNCPRPAEVKGHGPWTGIHGAGPR